MLRRDFFPLLAFSPCLLRAQKTDRVHGRSMVIARGGIVATSQVLASQAGAMILSQGGSAVDAAIAANAVLGVVEPMMCGIGGDLFVMYRDARTGQITGLNASGPAPRCMTIEALAGQGSEEDGPHRDSLRYCPGLRPRLGGDASPPWQVGVEQAVRLGYPSGRRRLPDAGDGGPRLGI